MIKRSSRSIRLLSILVLVLAYCAIANAQLSDPRTTANPKVEGFVKRSGYENKSYGNGIFSLAAPSGTILVASSDETLIIGMVVAVHGKFAVNADSLSELLKLAHTLDYLKIGIDDDGDVFVRSEQRVRLVDEAEFKDDVKRVIEGNRKIADKLAPYAIK